MKILLPTFDPKTIITPILALALCGVWFGCKPKSEKSPSLETSAAETQDSAAQAVDILTAVPPNIQHIENPAWKDMPTPEDMPELQEAVSSAWPQQEQRFKDEIESGCALGDYVYTLNMGKSQIGYVSYKNKTLPVTGIFENALGVLTMNPKNKNYKKAWLAIDPLSLESGNKVRTQKLQKLFFELEQKEHAAFGFESTQIQKQEQGLDIQGQLTLHGYTHALKLPVELTPTATGVKLKLSNAAPLLDIAWFKLVEPMKKLIQSCNHKAMGASVGLQIELDMVKTGCG